MSKKKGKKLNIDIVMAMDIFRAYGCKVRSLNFYTLRIEPEEKDFWVDWYHTRGTAVKSTKEYHQNIGVYKDPESLIIKALK